MEKRVFAGLTLDPFQIEAIDYLDKGESVIISAPTGVGKTLVADYLIHKTMSEGRRIVYTAPIKALSNQKYKEFKRLFGSENVGILTGDIVINPDAPILIMTTEIFRNILLIEPRRVYGTGYVILDEIHFIADEDRGSVWEESLIFMPRDMRFLGLSATIPNVYELADWVSSIREDTVKVVTRFDRVIPLTHYLYEKAMGIGALQDLAAYRNRVLKAAEIREKETGEFQDTRTLFPETTHIDLIDEIKDRYLPCLYFVFSRKQCEIKAAELAENHNFLSTQQADEVEAVFNEKMEGLNVSEIPSTKRMKEILKKGIGVHHAGLLPAVKESVEELFERRLIKVLYCTETFAVGINMPVKAVCFDSWQKYDGIEFRDLSSQEYYQMSGRAGRRGIDPEGYAFTLINMRFFNPDEFPDYTGDKVEELQSRFKLSYNTVLNLVHSYTEENIKQILDGNFAIYQLKRRTEKLKEELRKLEEASQRVSEIICDDCRNLLCPIEHDKLTREIHQIRVKLRTIPKKAWKRRKNLQRSLNSALLKLEGVKPKDCGKEKITQCAGAIRQRNRSKEEMDKIRVKINELDPETVFHAHFRQMVEVLRRLDYVNEDGTLAPRGVIASEIHVQELLVTELLFSGILHEADTSELAALAVSIDYEPRKEEYFMKAPFGDFEVESLVESIAATELEVLGKSTVVYNPHAAKLAYMWASGIEFKDLMKRTPLSEGDIVLAFRRAIDLLRQIRAASQGDETLCEKIAVCIDRMDRGVVRVDL